MSNSRIIKKSWSLVLIIIILLLMSSQSISASTLTNTMGYEAFFYISSEKAVGKGYKIKWSFSSSNPKIAVTVLAMTEANFLRWRKEESSFFYLLSNGNHCKQSGTFRLEYKDVWYLVFYYNSDSLSETTELTIGIEFTNATKNILSLFALGFIIILIFYVATALVKSRKYQYR